MVVGRPLVADHRSMTDIEGNLQHACPPVAACHPQHGHRGHPNPLPGILQLPLMPGQIPNVKQQRVAVAARRDSSAVLFHTAATTSLMVLTFAEWLPQVLYGASCPPQLAPSKHALYTTMQALRISRFQQALPLNHRLLHRHPICQCSIRR